MTKRVVIVGAGFGGLAAAKALRKSKMEVIVVDKTNHHLFQPLLYQVATAALSPADIAAPIRQVLSDQENTQVIMGEVMEINTFDQKLILTCGEVIDYDYLILSPGARHHYFGHDSWEQYAPGLKTLEDALRIRNRILTAFERAERCKDHEKALTYLNFVVVGAGPTGVEMAGAIAEIAQHTMLRDFRRINPRDTSVYLIERTDRVLPMFPDASSAAAERSLEKLGVKVLKNTSVTSVRDGGLFLDDSYIRADNIIWAAGNSAAPILKTLGVPLDRMGRVIVQPDWSIPSHPEVFVIGDAANFAHGCKDPLPGVCTVAIQSGEYVASVIAKEIPEEKRRRFAYFDKGSLATIGRAKAVCSVRSLQFSGFLAWLLWAFVHVAYLVGFRNRVIVVLQWGFLYITWGRSARLINTAVKEDVPRLISPVPRHRPSIDFPVPSPKNRAVAAKRD